VREEEEEEEEEGLWRRRRSQRKESRDGRWGYGRAVRGRGAKEGRVAHKSAVMGTCALCMSG